VNPELFHVFNQMPGRIFMKGGGGFTLAGAPLIKKNHSVAVGIKESQILSTATSARSTVYKNHGLSMRIAPFFVVKCMNIGNFKFSISIGL